MKQQFIPITKKARFVTIGNPDPKKILIVLHGYGQLVEYFIQKFAFLTEIEAFNEYLIVAPEGSHRFYLKGSSGRVGASWMTKELREIDIEENNIYIKELLTNIIKEYPKSTISILGFSQGGATAARFVATSFANNLVENGKLQKLILWASVFPPDLQMDQKFSESLEKIIVLGENDEFYSTENQITIKKEYELLNFSIISFDGNHDIDQKTLILLL